MVSLFGRDFLKEADFSTAELNYLLQLAATLKKAKKAGKEPKFLEGKNIVLLFEKDSTRTRCAFEVAANDQGAYTTYLGPSGSQMGKKESMPDTARVLASFYDGIEYRGHEQAIVETLAKYANVPVWNGLTNEWHPTQTLADMLTVQEYSKKPWNDQKFAYIGDARYNMGNSLMLMSAILGLDFRSIAPKELWTSDEVYKQACELAKQSGAKISRTTDLKSGIQNCDFLYTDVWVSMGEEQSAWQERIKLLSPYRITKNVMNATNNPNCYFLHCLPSFHNLETEIAKQVYEELHLECMEVTNEVFESPQSLVFQQAENRMHTIKAVMVATLANLPENFFLQNI